MRPVLEHALQGRLPRLTTHCSPMTPLFGMGVAFRCGQNFAVSGLSALFCHLEHHMSRSGQHDRLMRRRFSSQSGFTWPENRPSLGKAYQAERRSAQSSGCARHAASMAWRSSAGARARGDQGP